MPVSDVDRLTVRYGNAFVLMRDLRRMGETSVLASRPRKPVHRQFFVKTAQVYSERFAEADGRIPAKFEILHAAGWAPHGADKCCRPRPAKDGDRLQGVQSLRASNPQCVFANLQGPLRVTG